MGIVTVHILQVSRMRLREAEQFAQSHTARDIGLEPKFSQYTEDSREQRECSQTPPCAPLSDLLGWPLCLGSNLIAPSALVTASFMVCVL